MDPTDNMNQVNSEISNYGKNLELKCKTRAVRNTSINLGCMNDAECGYSWTDYVTREYILEIPHDKFTYIIQSTKKKGFRGGGGGGNPEKTDLI